MVDVEFEDELAGAGAGAVLLAALVIVHEGYGDEDDAASSFDGVLRAQMRRA